MIKTRKATIGDLMEFYQNARAVDLKEVEVATGLMFGEQPLSLLHGTQALIIEPSGEVLGIAGMDFFGSKEAAIWLLMTNAVERHKMEFLRWSKRYLEEHIFKRGIKVYNEVYAKNARHVTWLNWLGAEWVHEDDTRMTFILRKRKEE